MKRAVKLTVMRPNVVFDTIEGETVLLDLNSGNFFTLEGSGSVIMQYILEYGDWKSAISYMKEANQAIGKKIVLSVNKFLKSLVEEKILIPCDHVSVNNSDQGVIDRLKSAAIGFIPPKLNKFSDIPYLAMGSSPHLFMSSDNGTPVDEFPKNWPEGVINQGIAG